MAMSPVRDQNILDVQYQNNGEFLNVLDNEMRRSLVSNL